MPIDYPGYGFTSSDLTLLAELHSRQSRQGAWSRVQLVQEGPADYLAVWDGETDQPDPPTLAIARFKATGTYAVTRGDHIVSTGRTLREVVAAFGAAAEPATLRV